MPKPSDLHPSQKVSQQATEWFVLMNSRNANAQQRRAFLQWLTQSTDHQKAWIHTQAIWQGLEQLPHADLTELATIQPAAENHSPQGVFSALNVAFGSFALLLVALLFQQPFWYADFYTATGESKTITLSDNSAVELSTDSAVSVDYTSHHRRIVLHHGEAFFTVAADKARPFDVIAGETEIRALGTAFDVSRDGGDMRVTVFEHSVRVTAGGKQRIDKLVTGHSITYQNQHLNAIHAENLSLVDSWRQHYLVFEDKPLGDVVKALNRYRRLPIIILGSSIKNLAVTGVFDTKNTDTALQTIEETFALKSHRLPAGIVLLSSV